MTTALRRIQYGKESTRGTLVAADKILIGALEYNDERAWHAPEDEERNSLALLHRQTEIMRDTKMVFNHSLTYEQIIDFWAMGVKGGVTPTTPTNGILTRDWLFLPTLSALNAPDSYTFEYGDDQQEYEAGHVMMESLDLNFAQGEIATMSANLWGQATAKSAFTGALSVPTLSDVVTGQAKIYLDTTWAALGTTQLAGFLAAGALRLPTGIGPVRYGDGSLAPTTFSEKKRGAELEITVRHNTDGVARFDDYVASTLAFIRIEFTGPEIEQVAPTYDKLVRLDLAVRWSQAPKFFDDHEGHNTIVLRGNTFHDPISNNDMSFFARNILTTL